MNKQEYTKRHEALWRQIDDLKRQIEQLDATYIEFNAPFPVGSKVTYTDNSKRQCVGWVAGYEGKYTKSNLSDGIFPVLFKQKKDGSKSRTEIHNWSFNVNSIRLAE